MEELIHEQKSSGSRVNDSAIRLVKEAATRPEGLTFDGLKRLRTEIGSRINGKIVPEPGTSQPALEKLYNSLSDDLRTNLDAYAKNRKKKALKDAFEHANSEYDRFADQRKELAQIIGERADAPAVRVFERLLSMAKNRSGADISKLSLAKTAMVRENQIPWNEIGSAIISRMGLNKKGEFTPAQFLNDYSALSASGKRVLFGDPQTFSGVRQSLDDIATISKRFNDIKAFGNPSGTARTGAIAGAVTTASLGLATGNFLPPLGLVSSIVGGRALANHLARPVTAKAVSK